MSQVVFYGMPIFAHTIQTFPLVKELVDKGENVIYYSNKRFEDAIKKTGAEFREYLQEYENDPSEIIWGIHKFMPKVRDIIIAESENLKVIKPDYIIYDYLAVWGAVLAQILKLPSVVLHSSIMINRKVSKMQPRLKRLRMIAGKPHLIPHALNMFKANYTLFQVKREFSYRGNYSPASDADLVIVNTSREFQPYPETFDDRHRFIGWLPTHEYRKQDKSFSMNVSEDEKLVYISLGTTFNRNRKFYTQCFTAFRDLDCKVLISTGGGHHLSFPRQVPDNFILADWVPQLDILELADVFVTQGGTSSVSESLNYGCPVVVVPQSAEQPFIGYWVEQLEVGKNIESGKFSASELRSAVDSLLADPQYRKNCLRISKTFKDAGGVKYGVEEIFKLKDQFRSA